MAEKGVKKESFTNNILGNAKGIINGIGDNISKIQTLNKKKLENIDVESIIFQLLQTPLVKVDRTTFLKAELKKKYPEDIVEKAIEKNPAQAGITREEVDKIAKKVIEYETWRVTSISFLTGIPGTLAVFATVPADILQYMSGLLISLQKLMYLYGYEEIIEDKNAMSTEDKILLLSSLGAMFGIRQATVIIKVLSSAFINKVARDILRTALTKTSWYPFLKLICKQIGIKISKRLLSETLKKSIPLISGVLSGGFSYFTYKPSCRRLQSAYQNNNICNPEYYLYLANRSADDQEKEKNQILDMVENLDVLVDEIENETLEDEIELEEKNDIVLEEEKE